MNRLGQLGFGDEATRVADLLIEMPWVLHPRRVTHDLALQGQENLLVDSFGRLRNKDGEEWGYIRGCILKALSSLPEVSEGAISLLQDNMLNGRTLIERTMASEALLFLKKLNNSPVETLVEMIKQTEDGYLAKNYALVYASVSETNGPIGRNLSFSPVLNEALEYARIIPDLNHIHRYEPDILRENFYEGNYPDDDREFEDFPY